MKKCIVISDSFKGTLSTLDICAIAREVFPAHFPDCELVTLPVADGGEGTVACFLEALRAQLVAVSGSRRSPARGSPAAEAISMTARVPFLA